MKYIQCTDKKDALRKAYIYVVDDLVNKEGLSFSIQHTHTVKDIEVLVNAKEDDSWITVDSLCRQYAWGKRD